MDAIKIYVNKQMDGYVFTILPTMRELIKGWYPDCRPANKIFVSYDIKSGFEISYGKLEKVISPALLGIENINELNGKVNEIQFVETQTGKLLHAYKVWA